MEPAVWGAAVMKWWKFQQSFRWKLLGGFLISGIVPLVVCTVLILNIFTFTLQNQARHAAGRDLEAIRTQWSEWVEECRTVAGALTQNATIQAALRREAVSQNVYRVLYEAADQLEGMADLFLFDQQGQRLYSTVNDTELKGLPVEWGVLEAARQENALAFRRVEEFGGADTGHLLRGAQPVHSSDELLGYVMIAMDQERLDLLFIGAYEQGADVALLDRHWRAVYASDHTLKEQELPELRERLMEGQGLTEPAEDMAFYVIQEEGTGFFLLLKQPWLLAGGTVRLLYLITVIAIALCLLLCAGFSMGLSRQLFQPVRALNDAMGEMELGNLDVQVPTGRTDEMGQLAWHFNRMAQRLKQYLEESIQRQRELNDVRIRMMQAQLNPHFLYNTLDAVKWLGKIHQAPEISTISTDLAEILRSSISSREFVALDEELALFRRYVEIQNIRFPGKFTFQVDVEEQVKNVLVPKLMLQPLVENAVIHGCADREHGVIRVEGRRLGGSLVLTVEDDGCGMSEESLRRFYERKIPEGGHLGLYNVDAILRLHYGAEHGLRFMTRRERGTCIRITLPISDKEGRQC